MYRLVLALTAFLKIALGRLVCDAERVVKCDRLVRLADSALLPRRLPTRHRPSENTRKRRQRPLEIPARRLQLSLHERGLDWRDSERPRA